MLTTRPPIVWDQAGESPRNQSIRSGRCAVYRVSHRVGTVTHYILIDIFPEERTLFLTTPRPFAQQLGDCPGRDISQFLRFQLVQTPAVDPAFFEHRVRADLIQEFPDLTFQFGAVLQGVLDRILRVEHQVDIGGRRPRIVQDEAKRPAVLLVAAAEIGTDERRRRPAFLCIPEGPVPAEVPVGNTLRLAFLKIFP